MSHVNASSFRVISRDDNGEPVHCSHCARGMKHVVVLSLTTKAALEERIAKETDDKVPWVGLCAYCVLAMARALEAAAKESS